MVEYGGGVSRVVCVDLYPNPIVSAAMKVLSFDAEDDIAMCYWSLPHPLLPLDNASEVIPPSFLVSKV
jgi:hypothetical protein